LSQSLQSKGEKLQQPYKKLWWKYSFMSQVR
jgi:hypothetical protein